MKLKRIIALFCLSATFLAVIGLSGCAGKSDDGNSSVASAASASIKVAVVFEDGSQHDYDIVTDKRSLSAALLDNNLLTAAEVNSGDGLYTVVDGVRAEYNADGAWWCVYANGEMAMIGMDELVPADGDEYRIVYTKS